MNNLSNLSSEQLLLARIFAVAPAKRIGKELDRRANGDKPTAAIMSAAERHRSLIAA